MIEKPVFEESSGNVFADLGLENADELFIRGKIGIQVIRLVKQRNLKEKEISELLEISLSEVSDLMKGEFQKFTEGKLLNFLKRLDMEITLYLRPCKGANQETETMIAL
ncbi:helix-turn-helix domain-containing protein [Crocosphaera sp.]|uniref:helix-turn-helix domain-containing protein n=1 Tax=Crocosphaera sp. TaxID=2729996 RepID=UPI003F286983